jgi:hypothetical protein
MSSKRANHLTIQGVELIDLVIARARNDPQCIAGFCGDHPISLPHPLAPGVIESLRFPSERPLPPSLKRWLSFDAGWLEDFGWFAALEPPRFSPRTIGQIADVEFGRDYELLRQITGVEGDLNFYAPLDTRLPECFLLPEGSDSRRIFAITEPDELGEYPVLVIDEDDVPYAAIMYPGFDVYMADLAGLLDLDFGTYEDLHNDKRYATRMRQHAEHIFYGRPGTEMQDPEWCGEADWPVDDSVEE